MWPVMPMARFRGSAFGGGDPQTPSDRSFPSLARRTGQLRQCRKLEGAAQRHHFLLRRPVAAQSGTAAEILRQRDSRPVPANIERVASPLLQPAMIATGGLGWLSTCQFHSAAFCSVFAVTASLLRRSWRPHRRPRPGPASVPVCGRIGDLLAWSTARP